MVFLLFFKLSDVIHTACRSFLRDSPWADSPPSRWFPVAPGFALEQKESGSQPSRRGDKGRWLHREVYVFSKKKSMGKSWGLCVFSRFCSECSNIQVAGYGLVVCILVSRTVLSIKQLQEITNLLGGSNVVKPVGDNKYQINLQCFKF